MSKDTPKPAAFGPWVAKVLAVPNLQEAREQLVYAHIALSHARGNGDCPRESVDKAHIAIEMALAAIRAYEPVETTLAAPSFPAQPATELRRLRAESERDEALLRQALEALESCDGYIGQLELIVYSHDDTEIHDARAKAQSAIAALRERLSKGGLI